MSRRKNRATPVQEQPPQTQAQPQSTEQQHQEQARSPGDIFTFDGGTEDASRPAPAAVAEATPPERQATPTAEHNPGVPAGQEQSPDHSNDAGTRCWPKGDEEPKVHERVA
jgi:hypothetical protein